MKKADVVVVGGSAAGPVAGITVRRHYKDVSILLIRKESKVMVPCGIPYIFGTVGSPDKNVIPDALLSNNGIELMVDEVTMGDRVAKTLTTAGGETIGYEKLILATGSLPLQPPIPGMELENVFAMYKDADYLGRVQEVLRNSSDLVIIGGGFIGAEMADECKKIGNANVTIVEILPHCLLLALDEEFCVRAEDALTQRGIRVITNNGVKAILGDGKVNSVELQSGDKLKADAVIIGIGAVPNTELARKMGLKIGEQRGIWVDKYMRTSDKNIFACGDCAEKFSFFTKKPSGLRLASIATIEARIAGANVFKPKRENKGAVGIFSTAFGDFALSAAGLTEKAAKDAGLDVVIGEAAAADKHPGSMPNARELKTKLIFDRKTRKLIGGELSGGTTTGEMANVIAALIQKEMTADEVATFQMGTHPALTASPIVYQIVNAAEQAAIKLR
ncbi:MAG TPA: pyridine nucleotide-disulfide oxidoreductase [Dehalococcoidia bacterium]|nr:pyridine nucleotide-disulfide oxidoreductase [Dehalococcoidia bacterium]